ncbi:hypothetical protein [Faecalibacter rhinopitheci]|uniref:Uncharacterized protein n=1 Tax=Faecalibacter rhinopitheci TaxID=2779678 RepID=A0A8J7K3X2_9FLAO|nr:hypothetical protein [Faecalibacter rhinopitheci]MBF0596704.1 hypothetical protein [Faecalibacter rhinopitheci]MBQ0147558.1 hypothetical protein [Candidatus Onthonaster equi]
MKKALECALILTDKHLVISKKIQECSNYTIQKKLRHQQSFIEQQIIQFLEEIQEFKDLIMLQNDLKMLYIKLINYYSKQIHLKINRFQMELDLLEFESKFALTAFSAKKHKIHNHEIEIIQQKLNSYYQLIKK